MDNDLIEDIRRQAGNTLADEVDEKIEELKRAEKIAKTFGATPTVKRILREG